MEEFYLISAIKNGDNNAFKVLIKEYKHKIYSTSISIVQNKEDAEDITQEVFIEIHRSIAKFKGECSLSTWIYSITVSKAYKFIRDKKRQKRFAPILSIFGTDGAIKEINNKYFYHPGVELENKERATVLFKAIDSLPENQKTAFLLHKTQHQSYEEISVIMKTSISAVESLMFRAKQNLQKILGDYYEKNEL